MAAKVGKKLVVSGEWLVGF